MSTLVDCSTGPLVSTFVDVSTELKFFWDQRKMSAHDNSNARLRRETRSTHMLLSFVIARCLVSEGDRRVIDRSPAARKTSGNGINCLVAHAHTRPWFWWTQRLLSFTLLTVWVKKVAPLPKKKKKLFCDIFSNGEPVQFKILLVFAQPCSYLCTNLSSFIWMNCITFTSKIPQIISMWNSKLVW